MNILIFDGVQSARLGNAIHFLVNMIHYAKTNGFNKIIYKKQNSIGIQYNKINEILLNDNDNDNDKNENVVKNVKFNDMYFKYTPFNNLHENIPINDFIKIGQQYISLYGINNNKILNDEHVLTIHIRSEDNFKPNTLTKYIQPPLCFYEHVIDNNPQYTHIKIVSTPDMKNPVIKPLLEKYKDKISFQASSVKNDFETLVNCTNYVLSSSTFSFHGFICNKNIKKCYIFETEYFGKNIHSDLLIKYVPTQQYITSFLFNNENLDKMINFPIENIIKL